MTIDKNDTRLVKWTSRESFGSSARTMLNFLGMEITMEPSYPHDSSDFGRCLKVLQDFPEWEARLPEMYKLPGVAGEVWAALAPMWGTLKGLYMQDANLCSRAIKAIIAPLEAESGQVIPVGKNAKIILPCALVSEKSADHEKASVGPQHGKNDEKPADVSGRRIKSYLERIERLEEEKKGMADDIKDIYAEAKGTGFDPSILRKMIRLRKMDIEKRREEDALLELYMAAIGME